MEEWKSIEGYPRYEVSSLGRVRSIHYKSTSATAIPKVLSASSVNDGGYHSVVLCKDKKHVRRTIHRLVATTFIPNPDNLPEVDHINRNKKDNTLTNLRWVTSTDNRLNRVILNRSTPEHYIYASYRVAVPGHKEKRFKTLDSAISYRDSLVQIQAAPV